MEELDQAFSLWAEGYDEVHKSGYALTVLESKEALIRAISPQVLTGITFFDAKGVTPVLPSILDFLALVVCEEPPEPLAPLKHIAVTLYRSGLVCIYDGSTWYLCPFGSDPIMVRG